STLSASDWGKLRTALGEQVLLGMSYYSGGHLTHGYRHNFSSRMFRSFSYDVDRETNLIDYEKVRDQAKEIRPLILLAGYSAYPRNINFRIFREIADEVGAVLMVDMAHFAGLVAGGVMANDYNPVVHADVVTTTTHKTLRGPRGGMVLSSDEFADHVDKGCPLVLGGPLPHVMAAKAVGLQENNTEDFRDYSRRVVQNASALANACVAEGMDILTGGTDNHLLLLDTTPFDLTGRQAESAVREINITLNRNSLPFDSNGPWYTSGLRIGTPALTTLGAGPTEMQEIASIIKLVLSNTSPATMTRGKNAGSLSKSRFSTEQNTLTEARSRTAALAERFPVYPELDLDYLQKHLC
ncbi:serine hydroxymethyltransferase, partial [Dehalococcoidia bacterium]|nr:serine hydroxymethyltransferase [Dehalococcoidia bacterium]